MSIKPYWQRHRWLGSLTTPAGYEAVEAYRKGNIVLVLGVPPNDEHVPEEEAHNCDAMGCGQCHVILRADLRDAPRIVEQQAKLLALEAQVAERDKRIEELERALDSAARYRTRTEDARLRSLGQRKEPTDG